MSLSSFTLQTLFAQFQTRYPMGSLISEFLTIHDGVYAVRAIAQIGPTILATGMAAHPDLEAAEDRAKVRALEALAMPSPAASLAEAPTLHQSSQASTQFEPASQPAPQRSPEVTTSDLISKDAITQDLIARGLITKGFTANVSLQNSSSTPSVPSGDIPTESPLSSLTPPLQLATSADVAADVATVAGSTITDSTMPSSTIPSSTMPSSTVVDSVVADFYSHINADADEVPDIAASWAIAETPSASDKTSENPATHSPPTAAVNGKPRRKTATSTEQSTSSPASVDLSDVIAQTDVELARLGWNKVQGREHLKQTYGKRSRQELNETELYDFLHYLQAQ
ncbi:MAG: hypothetical protein SFY66_18760 [Oculatellaceae cyanobacterium bins.114]|nr:hypothetical protein [Oculatellaceae cyanobacterium bins.114]